MIRTICISLICIQQVLVFAQSPKHGRLVTEKLTSEVLRENRIGLGPDRTIKIYLPPSYEDTKKSYPVVYYFHSMFTPVDQVFDNGVISLLESAFAEGVSREFIFVAADYSSPTIGSLYENSPVSGRWIDFTVNELVPFIDNKFRTIKQRDSRAVVGHFIGGRGALKLVMTHAEVFGVAYAMHPVAMGYGYSPWSKLNIDWKKVFTAKSFADVGDARIFVAVGQAFSPNLNRPPLYGDFMYEPDANGEPKLNPDNIIKSKAGFHLDETLNESAANLRSLRGLAFDWARFDGNQDHVRANQVFSLKLNDLGVNHEAEEYNGDPWSKIWSNDGRFYTRVIPFFEKHLIFKNQN
jgi:hypothetical protein